MDRVDNYIEKLSIKWSTRIMNGTNSESSHVIVTEDDREELQYVIHCRLSEVTKFIPITAVAAVLNVVPETMVAYFTVGILRMFCGGVHAQTWNGCLAYSTIVISTIVFISHILPINNLVITLVIYVITTIIMSMYAPSDSQFKPLNKSRKPILKITSLFTIQLLVVLSYLLNSIVSNVILLSVLVCAVLILPISYKILGCGHGDAYWNDD